MLDKTEASELAIQLLEYHQGELASYDVIYNYWNGYQGLPIVPMDGVPREVRRLATMSRINVISLVVSVMAQSLYVDGYREDPATSDVDAPAWAIWQTNRMDAHQTGVHRAALAYGMAYVIVLPGDDGPTIRGVSPRSLVAVYDEDTHDWPRYALEVRNSPWAPKDEYWLYDEDSITILEEQGEGIGRFQPEVVGVELHDLGKCPVTRFRNTDRLNEPPAPDTASFPNSVHFTGGEVEPLMALQDQIDETTFALLTAQHFQSFRQRYIMGWTAEAEDVRAKANASRLWTFEDPEVKVGEFGQVDLGGYLNSRESTVTQIGVISQTPGHELLGRMANLSAEALVAASVGQRHKVLERQQLFGESWEQCLGLASEAAGLEVSDSAQVQWRDTEPRSLSQTIDALGKLTQMLAVPPEMLWERIPGVSQQDVARWQAAREEGDALARFENLLNQQAAMGTQPTPPSPQVGAPPPEGSPLGP